MFASALPLLLLTTLNLLAQAGGGGSYGSGSSGGGGGGSSGGGEGGGELIALLIELTFRYPQIGIPMWIVVGIVFYVSKNTEQDARVTRTIRRGRKVQEESLYESAIVQIQERDPDFDLAELQHRIVEGFVKTQYAWGVGRIFGNAARSFLTECASVLNCTSPCRRRRTFGIE